MPASVGTFQLSAFSPSSTPDCAASYVYMNVLTPPFFNFALKRSMELLQLRRDRVVRADSIIDKNQALILSAPNLLPRLMELLRVMNFNPSLALFGAAREGGREGGEGMLFIFCCGVWWRGRFCRPKKVRVPARYGAPSYVLLL